MTAQNANHKTLSPRDLALAIGMSESSLKRWVDRGKLQATRTAGGHRRIEVAEAIRFIRATKSEVRRPDMLGLTGLDEGMGPLPEIDDWPDHLLDLLKGGQSAEARAFILSMYLAGWSIASICDGPISISMHNIGELWNDGTDGIFVEHRATDICIHALNDLRSLIQAKAEYFPAVGGCISHDQHMLPSLMAVTSLLAEGFDAINLGAETPVDAFMHAVEVHKAKLVWLSVSSVGSQRDLQTYVTELSNRLNDKGVSLICGGRLRDRIKTEGLPNCHFGSTMAELVAFAKGLQQNGH